MRDGSSPQKVGGILNKTLSATKQLSNPNAYGIIAR